MAEIENDESEISKFYRNNKTSIELDSSGGNYGKAEMTRLKEVLELSKEDNFSWKITKKSEAEFEILIAKGIDLTKCYVGQELNGVEKFNTTDLTKLDFVSVTVSNNGNNKNVMIQNI